MGVSIGGDGRADPGAFVGARSLREYSRIQESVRGAIVEATGEQEG